MIGSHPYLPLCCSEKPELRMIHIAIGYRALNAPCRATRKDEHHHAHQLHIS